MSSSILMPGFSHVRYKYAGSLANETPDGGFTFYDSADDTVKPISLMADEGSPTANRNKALLNFAGVSLERKLTTDAAGFNDVAPMAVAEYDCDSSTWKAGDLVGFTENALGTALEDKKVAKVTRRGEACGFCIEHHASAVTKVLCVICGVRTPQVLAPSRIKQLVSQELDHAAFTDGGGTSGHIDFSEQLPAGALVLGWSAEITEAFAGDTTGTIQVGTSGDADKFTADTTESAYAAGEVGSAAAAATAYNGTAAAPRVTITGPADWGNVTAGKMVVRVEYIDTRAF